ncbi:TadE/TadG family type IV pilus assembly protein [Methylobacterium sp. 77]|uniref:TadE/TadG family type IV pilus assembly protein n=1 Tax=Methylobacterium sp. 77 TaxID=1101192 RepID=UPI000376F3CE|nr:TadE/TadG family type IV pilus assembly protein [Methylobacterium sp. 77]
MRFLKIHTLWRRFGASRSGATAVEFALVGPLFFLALVEILQGGLYLFCSAAIDKATADAGRVIMLGALDANSASANGFRSNALCGNLLAGLSCDNVVTSLQSTTLGGTGGGYAIFVQSDERGLVSVPMDNSQTSYCTGAPGTYEYLQAFYAVPVFSPIWTVLNSTTWNGKTVVFARAAATFRNEPFTSASVSSGC